MLVIRRGFIEKRLSKRRENERAISTQPRACDESEGSAAVLDTLLPIVILRINGFSLAAGPETDIVDTRRAGLFVSISYPMGGRDKLRRLDFR